MIHWTRLHPVYSRELSFEESQIPQNFTASSDGVMQRSENTIFVAPKQLRRMPRSQCRLCTPGFPLVSIFWTRFCNEEAMNLGEPTAAPSNSNPSMLFLLILLSTVFTAPFDQTSHLSLLSSTPQVSTRYSIYLKPRTLRMRFRNTFLSHLFMMLIFI